MKIRIGTRASKLALWQAHHVQSLLENLGHEVSLTKITTKGDQILDRSLSEIGGKGLFLKEIEDALLANQVDIAVHSLKDVPFSLPEGLQLSCILPREDSTDAFVCNTAKAIADLPEGARVGTSSLRRSVQLKKAYPGLVFEPLRGNVDTRLAKLDAGEFDAIVLASAGLIRLGLADRITERLNIVSAVGQGAIGIECRAEDEALQAILKELHHAETADCVEVERLFLKHVEGSCQTPLGCHVTLSSESEFDMRAFYAKPDGSDYQIWQEAGTKKGLASKIQALHIS